METRIPMPDFSMCQDHDCPSRSACFRYVAKPGERQRYSEFERPVVFDGRRSKPARATRCNYYWPCVDIAEKEGGR